MFYFEDNLSMFRLAVPSAGLILIGAVVTGPASAEVHICKPANLCADFVKACVSGGGKHFVAHGEDGVALDVCERPASEAQMPFGAPTQPS